MGQVVIIKAKHKLLRKKGKKNISLVEKQAKNQKTTCQASVVDGYVAARLSLRGKCNNFDFKATVRSISLVVEVDTGSEDKTYLNYAFSNLDHHEGNTLTHQSCNKVVDKFTNKSK